MTNASPPTPILEARNLHKRYQSRSGGETIALRDVNLSIYEGDTLGIVGESGSGKSTLARILLALDAPSGGEVLYRDQVISGLKERNLRDFRQHVQMVFQDPMSSLDPRMRVHDLIAEPLRSLKLVTDEHSQVAELLESVGLPTSAARRYPHQFSGGQRQRIAIARALGTHPETLMADEPVSALDVSVRAQILNLLTGLVRDFNLTLLFISHDMAVVRHLCNRIIVMRQGEVVESGLARDIYEHPQHPYTRELLAAAPRIRPKPKPSASTGRIVH
ncbi:ABC transporter ATP-binding protein [Leekyejoonella antrihumi]|uniref:ABC transporter ATP-binding protein n=1 Tax=Leekyejoonella antrihumi TaxID=1660198 RepID=A0A563E0R2_9MICO|nr:ATP-binding cassette domain-containing protein [Leekyejoonella antrihumi]TWP35791.1 ABC transporter ATP-binding protein [Leekyejoonella antrihumi]